MFERIICRFQGHHYRATESKTPLAILNSLIEDEFVYDMALDKELTARIKAMAERYVNEYRNASIANLICIKCGRKEPCIKTMEEKMRKELTAFLFRADKNLESLAGPRNEWPKE